MGNLSDELILVPVRLQKVLLTFTKPRLISFALRDVPAHFRCTHNASACIANRRYRERDRDATSIFSYSDRIEMLDALASPDFLQNHPFFVVQFRRNDRHDRLANDVFRQIAKNSRGGAVPRKNAALQRLANDGVLGRLNNGSQQGLLNEVVLTPGSARIPRRKIFPLRSAECRPAIGVPRQTETPSLAEDDKAQALGNDSSLPSPSTVRQAVANSSGGDDDTELEGTRVARCRLCPSGRPEPLGTDACGHSHSFDMSASR